MIKLIASDMDGTLLNNKMEISDNNAAAIRAAQAAGIDFIIATGRGISKAKPLVTSHGLETEFITINGALVIDRHDQPVVKVPIPNTRAKAIIDLLNAEDFYFELVTDQGPYSESRVRRIQNVADLLVVLNPDQPYKIAVALAAARLELMNINYIDNFYDLLTDEDINIYKIIAFDKRGQQAFANTKAKLAELGQLAVTSSSDNNIEINDVRAQKGIALAQYAKIRNIPMSQVMAIGDNLNDASMIKAAGVGVAMANAVPEITELADRTTDFNTKDGVAKAIQWALDQKN
ncbi:Cof-type HAD-IIB family hydrolase [Agrilactobacillus yilanensis]|uniref:Cof-type HAD-IIB family hydrolase n=1 Tax=Agrilactobacillus yilanensis TaxID=2485997 RepID=A0ABW4J859_9LACO|nr:Cof-type HAD-IIB family hydrolase [Agrilactobacillus yilanensis]